MKYATIKERRAAADLLAIKAGRVARGPEDIEKASLLTDQEVWDLLKENTPDAQAVEVEEIKPGEDPDKLPADLFGYCNNLINEFCSKFNLDPFKLSPLQWGAACSYVGRGFSSRSAFRVINKNNPVPNCKKIDSSAAAAAVPVWRDLCLIYSQVPFMDDFCMFAGISYQWLFTIEEGRQGVTPADIELYKEVRKIARDGLNKRLVDGKAQQVGAIFYAKAKEGYQETQTIRHEYDRSAGSVQALPDFGSFQTLPGGNT